MFLYNIQRVKSINDYNYTFLAMALDPRLRPGVLEELRGSRSFASTPSLRSRDATPNTTMTFGGNVKVVVRVRGFLPRGKL